MAAVDAAVEDVHSEGNAYFEYGRLIIPCGNGQCVQLPAIAGLG